MQVSDKVATDTIRVAAKRGWLARGLRYPGRAWANTAIGRRSKFGYVQCWKHIMACIAAGWGPLAGSR